MHLDFHAGLPLPQGGRHPWVNPQPQRCAIQAAKLIVPAHQRRLTHAADDGPAIPLKKTESQMSVDPDESPELDHSPDLSHLLRDLQRATGGDREIDARLADCLGLERDDYTSDASLCRELVRRTLPQSRLQVGYDVNGVLPSAALQEDTEGFSAIAPTVPWPSCAFLSQRS